MQWQKTTNHASAYGRIIMSTSYFLTLHIRKMHSTAKIKKYIFTALSITFLDETGFYFNYKRRGEEYDFSEFGVRSSFPDSRSSTGNFTCHCFCTIQVSAQWQWQVRCHVNMKIVLNSETLGVSHTLRTSDSQ